MTEADKNMLRNSLAQLLETGVDQGPILGQIIEIVKGIVGEKNFVEETLLGMVEETINSDAVQAIINDVEKVDECEELVVSEFDRLLTNWKTRIKRAEKRQNSAKPKLKVVKTEPGQPLFPLDLVPATAGEGSEMSEVKEPVLEESPEVSNEPAVPATAEIAPVSTPVPVAPAQDPREVFFQQSYQEVRAVMGAFTAQEHKDPVNFKLQLGKLEVCLLKLKKVEDGKDLILDIAYQLLDELEFHPNVIFNFKQLLFDRKSLNIFVGDDLLRKFKGYKDALKQKQDASKPKPKSEDELIAEKEQELARLEAEAAKAATVKVPSKPKADKPKVEAPKAAVETLEQMMTRLEQLEADHLKAGIDGNFKLKGNLTAQGRKLRQVIYDIGDSGRLALHGRYSTLLATELETARWGRLKWLADQVVDLDGQVSAEVLEKIEAVKTAQAQEVQEKTVAKTKVETNVPPATESSVVDKDAPSVQDEVVPTTEVKDATSPQAAVEDKTEEIDAVSSSSDDTVLEKEDDEASTEAIISVSAKAEETLVEPASVLTEAPAAEAGGEQVESESTGTSVQAALAVDGEFRGLVAKFEKSLEERLAAASLQIKEVVDRVNANATRVVNELVSYVDNRTEVVTRVTEKTASKAELNERSIEASVSNFNTALDKAMEDQLKDSKSFDSKLEEMKVSLEKKISDQGLDADKMSKRPSRMSNSARFVVAASLFLAFASLASGWWRSPSGVAPQLAKAGVVTPATDSGANKVEFQTETPPKKAKDEVKVVLIDEGNQLPPMKISVTFGETTIADETTLAAIADRSSDAGKVAYLIKQQTATQYKAIPSKEEQLKVWEKVSEVVKNIGTKEVRAKQREIAKAWSIEVNDDGSVICQPQDRERLEGMLANL